MIDRRNRNQMAQAVRALASGLITNDEFDDERMPHPVGNDPAIHEIYWKGVWPLYSDMQCYKLRGKDALDAEQKSWLARCVLFLKTDLPYEWPVLTRKQSLLLFIKNAASLGKANRKHIESLRRAGDLSVWPFLRKSDFGNALKSPKYCASDT